MIAEKSEGDAPITDKCQVEETVNDGNAIAGSQKTEGEKFCQLIEENDCGDPD